MFVEFIACKTEQTHDLRHRLLRPNQDIKEMEYSGDRDQYTYHCAAIVDGKYVGVASIYKEDLAGQASGTGWRIRGMCVEVEFRGRNYGLHLLGNCVSHARSAGGTYVWCNARKAAVGFYIVEDFEAIGEEFEIEGIGTHQVLIKAL